MQARRRQKELEDEDDIDRHLAMLNADFNCLACLLALVEESAAHLKLIYGFVHDGYLPSFSLSSGFTESSSTSRNISFSVPSTNDAIDLSLDLTIDNAKIINSTATENQNVEIEKIIDNSNINANISDDDDCGNPKDNVWKKVESSKNLFKNRDGNKEIEKNDDMKILYGNTRNALIDCLNHISKSFDLFLKHMTTSSKLQRDPIDVNININHKENENFESDLKCLSKGSSNVPSLISVLPPSFLQISELTNAYSKAANQVSKIIKSQNDFRVSFFFF